MKTDKELADAIVALGVGGGSAVYWLDKESFHPDKFVRDWRVCGALIEKCQKVYIEYIGEPEQTVYARAENNRTWEWPAGESLPRTINEACVEALSHKGE